jgi:hypothetical protein
MDHEVISLGGVTYITGTTTMGFISQLPKFQSKESPTRIPVTVINAAEQRPLTYPWIQNRIDELRSMDDIINASFIENVVIQVSELENFDFIKEQTSTEFYVETAHDLSCDGPYFLEGRTLYKAYRLYEDSYNALVCGVVQSKEEPFRLDLNSSQSRLTSIE